MYFINADNVLNTVKAAWRKLNNSPQAFLSLRSACGQFFYVFVRSNGSQLSLTEQEGKPSNVSGGHADDGSGKTTDKGITRIQSELFTDSYAIAAMMLKIDGWYRSRVIRKLPVYGRQRLYLKEN